MNDINVGDKIMFEGHPEHVRLITRIEAYQNIGDDYEVLLHYVWVKGENPGKEGMLFGHELSRWVMQNREAPDKHPKMIIEQGVR